jgi:hypothetical protein
VTMGVGYQSDDDHLAGVDEADAVVSCRGMAIQSTDGEGKVDRSESVIWRMIF